MATVDRSDYPRRDALVTLQADFTDPPERLPEMLRRFEGGADLVTVGRSEAEPRSRRWTRLAGRFLARSLRAPESVTDPYATLRLYRLFAPARALERIGPDEPLITYDGWAANAELLLRVWPFLRRREELPAEPAEVRRYRGSRFRAGDEVRGLFRAGRDASLRALSREVREGADGDESEAA